MWESYRAVEAGLGREENFLSLGDVLMSQEKLPCRLESGLARLGFLDKGGETEHIPQTFIGRFRRIMDSSQNAYNEDTSGLVARLDELERALFRAGQRGLNTFQNWERGQAGQITASSLVQSYKKRKFNETDA
ncbi:PREDICTED: DNA replication complex GINS protein PSF3 [Nanorana parkeri]|uniref:DNA replication complex GINS protein PSF3 n=1 Tax=Nanorana parkeri TaxID=125878 RepID=UPI000854C27E|nr:PREDICTED: DNA replication complex GINS protein PSF3 [Nanorana parkeri]